MSLDSAPARYRGSRAKMMAERKLAAIEALRKLAPELAEALEEMERRERFSDSSTAILADRARGKNKLFKT